MQSAPVNDLIYFLMLHFIFIWCKWGSKISCYWRAFYTNYEHRGIQRSGVQLSERTASSASWRSPIQGPLKSTRISQHCGLALNWRLPQLSSAQVLAITINITVPHNTKYTTNKSRAQLGPRCDICPSSWQPSASWGPYWGPQLKAPHPTTLCYSGGLKELLNCSPWCQQTPASVGWSLQKVHT